MNTKETDALRYPVGKFREDGEFKNISNQQAIKVLAGFSKKLKDEVHNISEDELYYRHRPGGWTIRQIIHHLADSNMNAFCRMKLVVTEDKPTIKPYDESAWANTDDAAAAPIESSLKIIEGLMERWRILVESMNDKDMKRTLHHPQYNKTMSADELLQMYAWHCEHHLAHIRNAKKFKNSF
jgi:uncharacterized damage-inducible protein DinB